MKRESAELVFPVVMIFALACSDLQEPEYDINETFTGVSLLTIHQAQGETRIERSQGDQVSVSYGYTYPESCYEPSLVQADDWLDVKGIFQPVACSGRADILLQVPDGLVIEYHGSQANLVLSGIAAEIDAYAGNGIVAQGFTLTGDSELWGTEGGVNMTLGETPAYGLSLNSRDGNVTLNAAGYPLQGRFEFKVNEAEGEIRSPYPFDEEVRYDCQCEPGVTWWLRKVFTLGQDQPHFTLSTRNGIAELVLQ